MFAGNVSTEGAKERYLSSLSTEPVDGFRLGHNTTHILQTDPKLLLFTLSRYKFVAKMFAGYNSVLEIGCQEAWGMPLVAQNVKTIHGIDFYEPYIASCTERLSRWGGRQNMSFSPHDFLDGPIEQDFDGIFALDVLEHIEKEFEDTFIQNILSSMASEGTTILGMPSLESQRYASEASRLGHVNCKTGPDFAALAHSYFHTVHTFCMNDEVLHTGFFPMAQYLFVVCSNPRD